MGLNGSNELKNHIWFREFDWRALMHKKLKPPFVPPKYSDNIDSKLIKEKVEKMQKYCSSKSFKVIKQINENNITF